MVRKSKEQLWKEYLDDNILVKRGKGYIISGGGKVMLYLVYIYGGWKKYIAFEKKNNNNELDYIKKFKSQERKYGIKVKIENPKMRDFDRMNITYSPT